MAKPSSRKHAARSLSKNIKTRSCRQNTSGRARLSGSRAGFLNSPPHEPAKPTKPAGPSRASTSAYRVYGNAQGYLGPRRPPTAPHAHHPPQRSLRPTTANTAGIGLTPASYPLSQPRVFSPPLAFTLDSQENTFLNITQPPPPRYCSECASHTRLSRRALNSRKTRGFSLKHSAQSPLACTLHGKTQASDSPRVPIEFASALNKPRVCF